MSTPTGKRAVLGIAAGVGLLGAIVATQVNFWQPAGYAQQCECIEMGVDDAGDGMSPLIVSFGANDNPDATIEDRMLSACAVEANASCGTTGQAYNTLTPAQKICYQDERSYCMSTGVGRGLACRVCTPPEASSQTEAIKVIPRASSNFNCSCRIIQFDAGNARVRQNGDGSLVEAPAEQIIAHAQAIGTGFIRGIPCAMMEELRSGVNGNPRYDPLPRECHGPLWDAGNP